MEITVPAHMITTICLVKSQTLPEILTDVINLNSSGPPKNKTVKDLHFSLFLFLCLSIQS